VHKTTRRGNLREDRYVAGRFPWLGIMLICSKRRMLGW
jgi:hypothetical protein